MKKLSISFLFTCFSLISYGQITKNNWLIGGNARVAFIKQTLNSSDANGTNIQLSPSGGYFFANMIAGGLRGRLAIDKVEFNAATSKTTEIGIGPFLRYYFLGTGSRANLLAESAYQYIHYSGNTGASNNANAFTFSAGPVFYLNTSVGMEFLLNYELYNNNDANTKAKTFFLSFGFQIHLEKDKNY